MACALITLVSMMQSQWVKDHPTEAERLGIALLIGAIACFIFWMVTGEKQATPPINNEGNFVGRDNSGRIVQAKNYFEAAPPPPKPTPPEPLPARVVFLGYRRIWVERAGQTWREATPNRNAQRGLIVEVENPESDSGPSAHPVLREVTAKLIFTDSMGNEGRANRAYWIGQPVNNVDLPAGESKQIFLGYFKNDFWNYCWNMRDSLPIILGNGVARMRLLQALSVPLTTCKMLPLTMTIYLDLEISIISVRTGARIGLKKYRITRVNSAEQYTVTDNS